MMQTEPHIDRHLPSEAGHSPLSMSAYGSALTLDSQVLLNGQRELLIRHRGQLYRLKVTRQGKLILTK